MSPDYFNSLPAKVLTEPPEAHEDVADDWSAHQSPTAWEKARPRSDISSKPKSFPTRAIARPAIRI
ncbi:MAG: hypothetical protein PUP91_37690, partial [Rhizonema sp. PD37]|nr:hypothetical protein [Rhizonema sp. PD37]